MEPELPPTELGVGACNDLLRFNDDGWWGGTAVITGAAGAAPSMHLAVMFNGIFSPNARDTSVRISLYMPEKNRTIIDEVRYRQIPVKLLNISCALEQFLISYSCFRSKKFPSQAMI